MRQELLDDDINLGGVGSEFAGVIKSYQPIIGRLVVLLVVYVGFRAFSFVRWLSEQDSFPELTRYVTRELLLDIPTLVLIYYLWQQNQRYKSSISLNSLEQNAANWLHDQWQAWRWYGILSLMVIVRTFFSFLMW